MKFGRAAAIRCKVAGFIVSPPDARFRPPVLFHRGGPASARGQRCVEQLAIGGKHAGLVVTRPDMRRVLGGEIGAQGWVIDEPPQRRRESALVALRDDQWTIV